MVMPVAQPQIYTNYLATVKGRRDHAVELSAVAGQRIKDSDSLRKRFLASASIREGIAVLFNMASGDERVEKRMQEMLKFALDDSSTQTLDVLKDEFLPACRAEVSLSRFHLWWRSLQALWQQYEYTMHV